MMIYDNICIYLHVSKKVSLFEKETWDGNMVHIPAQAAWMLVEHPDFGQLMRRARKRKAGSGRQMDTNFS